MNKKFLYIFLIAIVGMIIFNTGINIFPKSGFTAEATGEECYNSGECPTAGDTCQCDPDLAKKRPGICAPAGSVVICPPTKHRSFAALIDSIINFIFNIALVIAPIMFIIAGFSYITAAGDPAKIKKSGDIVIWTGIGLIVVLLAKGIIQVIQDIF